MSHHGTKAHGSKGRLYEPVAREDSSTPLKAEEQVAVEYCSDSESDGDAEAVPLASRQDRGKGPLRVSGAARPIQGPPPSALVHTNFLHQRRRLLILVALASALALGLLALLVRGPTFSTGADCPCRQPPDTPQYFRTDTGEWAGPTATGRAPFLAQTMAWDSPDRKNGNGQGDRTGGFVPNQPLQTAVPIEGMEGKESIFKMMGFLTPYQPSPGFGVDEHPLPPGAKIEQVHMLSRHGSRYPTTGSPPSIFGDKIAKMAGKFKAKGALSFLNDWSYGLGAEILVPKGRQELFESGKGRLSLEC